MKKLLLFISFIFFNSSFICAQSDIQWEKTFGGSDFEWEPCIQQTTDGGYIIAGRSFSHNGDVTGHHGTGHFLDYWIIKLDNSGVIQWEISLGGDSDDAAYSIQQALDGGYIVAGSSDSNNGDVTGNHGGADYWIVKLNNLGSIEWQKSLGGTSDDYAYSIQQTNDSGYIVAGITHSTDGDITRNLGAADCWIIKLNPTGSIQWQNSLGGSGLEVAYSIQQTYDSGYIVSGITDSNDSDVTGNHGLFDYWIMKLNPTGVIQWQKTLGGSGIDLAYSVRQTYDGGYIVAGLSGSNDGEVTGAINGGDYWIVKLDSTGDIQWEKSFGGNNEDRAKCIQQTTDGGYIVGGHSQSNDIDVTGNHGDWDWWVLKLDSIGEIVWEKSLGGSSAEVLSYIQQTSDGGYIVAGDTYSTDGDITVNDGLDDFWIVKLSSTVNVSEIQNSFINFQVTPNPFSNETVITFQLSSNDNVNVLISDIEGRVIKNLPSKNFIDGTNELIWNGTNNTGYRVDNGVYFVSINSDKICESKRVIVFKN